MNAPSGRSVLTDEAFLLAHVRMILRAQVVYGVVYCYRLAQFSIFSKKICPVCRFGRYPFDYRSAITDCLAV
jgi:hypothetical protein